HLVIFGTRGAPATVAVVAPFDAHFPRVVIPMEISHVGVLAPCLGFEQFEQLVDVRNWLAVLPARVLVALARFFRHGVLTCLWNLPRTLPPAHKRGNVLE